MEFSREEPDSELYHKLRWLMFYRLLFGVLLLGSTLILQLSETPNSFIAPIPHLYALIAAIFILSLIYRILLDHIKPLFILAYIQIVVDTFVVTVIIFITGGFSSLFSFLYLLVVIYTSMILFKKGSVLAASLCSIEYGVLIDLEYYGVIKPLGIASIYIVPNYDWTMILYKISVMIIACFVLAHLSSLLSEQERQSKEELRAMEKHVQFMERMAVVGEMAAGLAHEIKNPLASLRGSIQMLQGETRDNPGHQRLMGIVMREADRLNALVNEFLMFARTPSGNAVPMELGKTVSEILELFETRTFDADVTLTENLLPGIWIKMDASHLRQIIWNLLLNAAEAIKEKGRIHVEMLLLRYPTVAIQISDTGCGMSDETIASIFNPFFTTKSEGTGLGLSIVHRIVDYYNIRLDVKSEPGKGTVFSLKLKQIRTPKILPAQTGA